MLTNNHISICFSETNVVDHKPKHLDDFSLGDFEQPLSHCCNLGLKWGVENLQCTAFPAPVGFRLPFIMNRSFIN